VATTKAKGKNKNKAQQTAVWARLELQLFIALLQLALFQTSLCCALG